MRLFPVFMLLSLPAHTSGYENTGANLPAVPHGLILDKANELILNLRDNVITELNPNEFAAYTSLEEVDLRDNDIDTIDPTAFQGVPLKELNIFGNKLTSFPDLLVLRNTLILLDISNNPLTTIDASLLDFPILKTFRIVYIELAAWPDFSLIGPNEPNAQVDINGFPDDGSTVTSVCHLDNLYMEYWQRAYFPIISCPSTSNLDLVSFKDTHKTDSMDFSRLSSLKDLTNLELNLERNLFTVIPDLPMELRAGLYNLRLSYNPIAQIDMDRLAGYDSTVPTTDDVQRRNI